MSKLFLQIEGKTGRVFQYSGTEKEGFEEYTNTKGVVSYRKYYNRGVYGELVSAEVRDSKLGQQISISLKLNGDKMYLQLPLYDQKGNVDNRYVESLLRVIGNLEKGGHYRFFPYAIEPQGDSKYWKYGVSVSTADLSGEEPTAIDKIEAVLTYSKEGTGENVIPNLDWEEKFGKNRPTPASIANKNDFLLNVLEQAVEGPLKWGDNDSSSSSDSEQEAPKAKAKAKAKKPVSAGIEDDDSDDLPF